MIPLIHPEDKVIVKSSKNFQINDIVVFSKNDKLVAHRVIHIPRKNSYILKGDNSKVSDGMVKRKDILGKVEEIKRDGQVAILDHIYYTQSSTYLKELKKLDKRFSKEGIDYLILKGLPVHIFVNKKAPRRLYLDADILIRRKDYKKIHELLKDLGYEKRKSKLFGKKVKNPTQVTYVKDTPQFPTAIDVHLEPAIGFTRKKTLNRLLPDIQPYTNYLFSNKSSVTINKTRFPILANEALITYLLLHYFHHNLQGAHRAHLIIDLVKKKKISWEKVSSALLKYKLIKPARVSLASLKKYFKLNTPLTKDHYPVLVNLIDPFSEGRRYKEAAKRLVLVFLFSQKPFVKKLSVPFRQLFSFS